MQLLKSIHDLIETLDFSHYSQSIFLTGNGARLGSEILLRTKLGNPETIFSEAKQVNRLYELETKSILKLLITISPFQKDLKELIFINLYPSTILDDRFIQFINAISSQFPNLSHLIVFEIIETEKVENISLMKERITFLKNSGYFIAMDDLGKGWSSLSMMVELEPDYIKLDQYFSIDLSQSLLKQELIKSILQYARISKTKVILEGIEHDKDLKTAKLLGVKICQGFLLDIPKPINKMIV